MTALLQRYLHMRVDKYRLLHSAPVWNTLRYWKVVWKSCSDISTCSRQEYGGVRGQAVHWLVKYGVCNSHSTSIMRPSCYWNNEQEPIAGLFLKHQFLLWFLHMHVLKHTRARTFCSYVSVSCCENRRESTRAPNGSSLAPAANAWSG